MKHEQIAEELKQAASLSSRYIRILEMKVAYMEGRIKTYLECAEGFRSNMNLPECIRDDLRRIKEDREGGYGLNVETVATCATGDTNGGNDE